MPDNLFDMSGRVAVVTGAASGLGQAMAIGLAHYGADVAIADINEAGMGETAARIRKLGRKVGAVGCDISIEADVSHLFEVADQVFGHVDSLINDPLFLALYKPEDLSLDDSNRVLSVKITGYLLCAKAAGKRMIQQGT